MLQRTMNLPEKERLAALEKVLDVDRFIRMLAMEVVLCHWDVT